MVRLEHVRLALAEVIHLLADGVGHNPEHQRRHEHASDAHAQRHTPPRNPAAVLPGKRPVEAHPCERRPQHVAEPLARRGEERRAAGEHEEGCQSEEGDWLGVGVAGEPIVNLRSETRGWLLGWEEAVSGMGPGGASEACGCCGAERSGARAM